MVRSIFCGKLKKDCYYLIPFEANAFYLVDQEESDFNLSVCEPSEQTAIHRKSSQAT